jgi:hypothetical protein
VYIRQPQGYRVKGKEDWLCKLKKSLYGLRGSSLAWHRELKQTLIDIGFVQSANEECLFTLNRDGRTIHTLVYVDDMVFFHNDSKLMNEVYDKLTAKYRFSSRGPLEWYVGMRIKRSINGDITLSQAEYIDTLVERFGLSNTNCQGIDTPWLVGPNGKLSKEMSPKTKKEQDRAKTRPYAEAVGALQWLVSTTRPDIAYAVSAVSRYVTQHGEEHWQAVLRIIKYLKNTRDELLTIKRNPRRDGKLKLEMFVDADWAGEIDGRRSQGGYIMKINGSTVAARSILQKIVSLSSMESGYISACEGAKEVAWSRRLMAELEHPQQEPTTMWEDNRAAIIHSEHSTNHNRTKHIDTRYHYLRQQANAGEIKLKQIATTEQEADILTKNTGAKLFIKLKKRMLGGH